MAVNEEPALRKWHGVPAAEAADENQLDQVDESKQSVSDKARREDERRHAARISRLFRAPEKWSWSRKDIFSLGKMHFRLN